MRPVAEIPEAFWNVTDDLGAPLPVLESWLNATTGGDVLSGVTILQVQHQLANSAAQADALVRLGAEPRRLYWIDIPYTSHATVRAHVQRTDRIPPHNFRVCDDYRVLSPYAPYQLKRTIELLHRLAEELDGPLLVLDDGAYVLGALAWIRRDRWPNRIAIVEQTTRGLIKLRASPAMKLAAQHVPIIDVAGSTPKRTLEPPFIAMSICASLDRAIRRSAVSGSLRRCLVLGYGAIGEQVATFLDRHFAVGKPNIRVFDADPLRCERAHRRGFPIWDQNDLRLRFDLVVGCSGSASFTVHDYVYLEDGALLASASSGAVELSRRDFIELSDTSIADDVYIVRDGLDERDLHASLRFHVVDRDATVANAGFPVNFDGRVSATPGKYIQPTPVMMCSAALQAAREFATDRAGLIDLDPAFGDWLDKEFRAELAGEAHFLVPPPEEAW